MDKTDKRDITKMIDGMSKDDREEIKDIILESLKDSGLTDAAETINTPKRMTKEEILAIKDRRTRQKTIRENLDLFKN